MNAPAAKLSVRLAQVQDQGLIEQVCTQSSQALFESNRFWQRQNALLLTEQDGQLIGLTQLRFLPQLNALGLLAHTTHLWLASPDLADDINEAATIYAQQHGAIRIETAHLAPRPKIMASYN